MTHAITLRAAAALVTASAALATIATVAAPATARADKQAPPAAAPAKPFALPSHRDLALENGARLTTIAYGSIPKAAITLVIRGGRAAETDQQVWLAELAGTALGEGTRSMAAPQLAEAAADMGGDLAIAVGADDTTIRLEVLSEFAPRAIALVADVARNPAFPEADVARVRSDLVRQLAVSRTQPQLLAAEQFSGALYPDHPYGRTFPTEAMLQSYTVDQVRAFYAAHTGAARSHLYVAGVFDPAAVEKAARDALADWAAGPEPTPVAAPPAAKPAVRVVDRPGAVQSTLVVGLPTLSPRHPDYVALLVTDALLGGSFGSRITSNIREQKGYTYSPNSQVQALKRAANWSERADVTTNVTGASLTEIFKEVARLRSEPPSDAELRGIQSYLAGTFVLRNSSRAGIIQQLSFLEKHELGDDYLRDFVHRIWAVKPADIQRIAQSYLDPKTMTIVVVGDRKQVDAQLQPWTDAAQTPPTAKPATPKPTAAKPAANK